MTRTPKKIDVQRTRRDNYAAHFAARKFVQTLPPELQMCYLTATQVTKPTKLNPYGADSYSDEDWTLIVNLAQQRGLQAFYINAWYTSNEGWQDFQKQWQELPDEFEMPALDLSWIIRQDAHA